jgi:hypothetical protein
MRIAPSCRQVRLSLLVCLILGGQLAQTRAIADEPPPADLSAIEIVERMADIYANCNTYRDSGIIELPPPPPGGGWPFKTAFVRYDRFRFECDPARDKRILWCNGGDVTLWHRGDFQSKHQPDEFMYGLAKDASVVHYLLLPRWFKKPPLTFDNVKRLDDAKLGDKPCFRIEARYRMRPITLWIDTASYLLRRTDRQMTERLQITTTYEPVLNEAIADNLLEFAFPRK